MTDCQIVWGAKTPSGFGSKNEHVCRQAQDTTERSRESQTLAASFQDLKTFAKALPAKGTRDFLPKPRRRVKNTGVYRPEVERQLPLVTSQTAEAKGIARKRR